MKRILFLLVALCALGTDVKAIVVQKVYLKDGSVLNGYIQRQEGDGKLTIHTDYATICINNGKATVAGEQAYGENSLSQAWKDWAEKNDEFQGAKDNRTLWLGNVLVNGVLKASMVKILESGATVKYLEMSPNTYKVDWKDVKAIKGDKRNKTALSGINRVYQLRNGEQCEGQYAEETDSTLSLYLANGSVRSFKIDDVIKYVFKPINPNQSLFEQSPLIDIVKTNHAEYRGVIIEQNYSSKKDNENYVLISLESGAIQSVKVSDIVETMKEENKLYSPKFDIVLNPDEVVVNRLPVEYVKVAEVDGVLALDSLSHKVVIQKDNLKPTQIIVESNLSNGKNIDMWQLVKVTKLASKKKTDYQFTYKDLVNSVVHAKKIEKSVNNTTRMEYQVELAGVYALYDVQGKRAIPIIVKK